MRGKNVADATIKTGIRCSSTPKASLPMHQVIATAIQRWERMTLKREHCAPALANGSVRIDFDSNTIEILRPIESQGSAG